MPLTKIIILEGPDGGGKSQLAARLNKEYNYAIVKTGPPKLGEDVTMSYVMALAHAIAAPGRTVFDRLHLGEAIYGPLLRGRDRMGVDGLARIEGVIERHGILLVICCPPWEALVHGWRSKDDLLKDEVQLKQVYDAYLAHAWRLGIKPYDWTAPDAEERIKEMIDAR